MNPKLLLCLALVLSGGLFGCSTTKQPASAKQIEIEAQIQEVNSLLAEARSNSLRTNFDFAVDSESEFDPLLPPAEDVRLLELLSKLEAANSVSRETAMELLQQNSEFGGDEYGPQYKTLMAIANQPVVNGPKFTLAQPWTNRKFTLLVAGSSNPPVKSRMETITAQWAAYRATDVTDSSGKLLEFWIAAIPNPLAKQICLMPLNYNLYVADGSETIACSAFGLLSCKNSYLEVPEADGGLKAAIDKFEKQFDAQKLLKRRDAPPFLYLDLGEAAPEGFFGGPNASNFSGASSNRLNAIELTDGILRMDFTSFPGRTRVPNVEKHGNFWINLKAKKAIKSVVDGQEMDLTSGEPYAVPLKTN